MRKAASVAVLWVVLTMTANGQSAPGSKGITAVPGIRVGQFTLPGGLTGCSVVLADGDGAVGGMSQRGGAPGTRETDLLDPLNLVERVNAVVLSGGSAFGLDAAQGAMRFLEEKQLSATRRVPVLSRLSLPRSCSTLDSAATRRGRPLTVVTRPRAPRVMAASRRETSAPARAPRSARLAADERR